MGGQLCAHLAYLRPHLSCFIYLLITSCCSCGFNCWKGECCKRLLILIAAWKHCFGCNLYRKKKRHDPDPLLLLLSPTLDMYSSPKR